MCYHRLSRPVTYSSLPAKPMATSESALVPKPAPPSGTSWRPTPAELVGWCVLAGVFALVLLGHTHTAAFGNDGYQYLSVADNIQHGNGIKTSIIYFDAERAHGTMPAPMTTFPPVYSICTAIVSLAGIPTEIAATGISLVSFAFLPLVLGLAVPGGIRPWAFRTMMLLLVLNSSLLVAADTIASETLFSLIVATAILCFSRALRTMKQSGMAWQLCAWLLIGLSYWTRYAGVFILAGALAFFSLHAVFRRGRRTLLHLSTSVLALGVVGASMVRNAAVTGSWKGGVAKQSIDLWPSPRPIAVALYHVLLGEPRAEVNIGTVLLFVGAAGLLLLGFWSWRQSKGGRPEFGQAHWMLSLLVCTYLVGMVYANMTMVISFGARYFIPLLPLIFLLVAYPLSTIESASQRPMAYLACIALMLTGYFVVHIRGLIRYTPPVPHQGVLRAFREPVSGGELTAWASANLSSADVITATNGQATAYALHRPTLCVVDPEYSSEVWSQARLLEEMQRFRSNYLIIYPGLRVDAAPVQRESPLIREMLGGEVPDGLEVVARNSSVIILRRILRQ